MDKFLISKKVVIVLLEHIGMVNGVKHIVVQVDKFGMVLSVFVSLDIISTELFVYFVLMAKNGIQSVRHVIVHQDLSGMETIVRELLFVQVGVSTTKQLTNVYVP